MNVYWPNIGSSDHKISLYKGENIMMLIDGEMGC